MLVCKTKRYKNSILSYKRDNRFRDNFILFPKRFGNFVFLTTFNNIFFTYEIISQPVGNGTYKVKISVLDDKFNESATVEATKLIDFYPLPPVDVVATVVGNDVTLTWSHSVEGAPTNYVIYGNDGSGEVINKNSPIATISGNLLTYTFTVASGQWKFVIESKNTAESDSMKVISVAVPPESVVPPPPGPSGDSPLAATGLVLEHVSVGKVRIRFLWLYGSQAAVFNVYHDGGTGTIDYNTPNFTFTRIEDFIQDYTTTQLHTSDTRVTYKFAVRAETTDGVEESNEDEYEIEVDGKAPDPIDNFTLDSVF